LDEQRTTTPTNAAQLFPRLIVLIRKGKAELKDIPNDVRPPQAPGICAEQKEGAFKTPSLFHSGTTFGLITIAGINRVD